MTETAPKVIVIPAKVETPQDQEKKRHLRVAAYCRVSTDSEEQLTSYQNQLAYYTEQIMKEPGWTMAGLFADEGITGTSAKRRKEFLRMIRQCRQGKIDLILTKSVSRFARNTVDTLTYTRELRSLGIPVLFEEQNINSIHPESEFLITLHGAFAQSESESTSSRVSWGKRQSMRSGRAIFQYKWLLGYERGPDGRPVVVPEEAKVVRSIYQWYLAGDTLRAIKERLEAQGALTATGSPEWTITNLRSILTNEKYCGDVLMQKTFVADCISRKVVTNTGQLDKYLLPDHHEAIVSRAEFDAVQLEAARRRALRGATRKSAPTGLGRYSGKYALSGLLFCGECGTAYRRCVWTQKGEKRPVWRCSSRLDYGKKYCKHSPTLDEEMLQHALLAAVNGAMAGGDDLARRLEEAMSQELSPIPGESMSLGELDRALEELGREFDALLQEAAANGGGEEYAQRFQAISAAMGELRSRKERAEALRQESREAQRRLQAITTAVGRLPAELTTWDEGVIYQLLEKVTVLAKDRIRVTFRGGTEVEQTIEGEKGDQ